MIRQQNRAVPAVGKETESETIRFDSALNASRQIPPASESF
jgi:hypothetical protein